MPGSGIFISYRRDDSAGFAGHLYDRLAERFGADRVFMDVDAIAPGHEFATDIEKALSDCKACVVLIGRDWLTITDEGGRRRLDDPTDFVRLEVATAIRRGITVFPVLVNKAKPPSSAALPDEIRPLAGRQAIELTNERWNYDVGRLLLSLEKEVGGEPDRRSKGPLVAAGVVALVVIAGLGGWFATRNTSTACTGDTSSIGSPAAPSVSEPVSGTFDVSLTLTSYCGILADDDNLWGEHDPQVKVSGDTWSSQVWIFDSRSWTVPEKKKLAGDFQEGSYSAPGDRPIADRSATSRSSEHFVPSGPTGSSADMLNGTLTIKWACAGTGAVKATFDVSGTPSG